MRAIPLVFLLTLVFATIQTDVTDRKFILVEDAIIDASGKPEANQDNKLAKPRRRLRQPRRPHRFAIEAKSSSTTTSSSYERCPQNGCCNGGLPYTNWIEDMDFYHVYPILEGPNTNWHYFQVGEFIANGGRLITGNMGGFLDTSVYTVSAGQTQVPELDHLKYFIVANRWATVPRGGQLVVEWKASAETFRTDQNPFGRKLTFDNDPRLASAAFVTSDPGSGTSFSFLLTNDRVYIMYSRDPYLRLVLNKPFAAFTYIIPVKMRACSDVHRLRVQFNEARREVAYFVDYRQVFKITSVGTKLSSTLYMTSDYGGYSEQVFPLTIEYGFGSFTSLDRYPVCYKKDIGCACSFPTAMEALVNLGEDALFPQYNPHLGSPHPANYYDPTGAYYNRLWGQGSESRIYKLSVYQVLDSC